MSSSSKNSLLTSHKALHLGGIVQQLLQTSDPSLVGDSSKAAQLKRIDQETAAILQLHQYCDAANINSHSSLTQQQLLQETVATDLAALALERELLTGATPPSPSRSPSPQELATLLYRRFGLQQPIAQQDGWQDAQGATISGSVLAEWLAYACIQLRPIFDTLKYLLLQQPVLHVEEIPVCMFRASHKRTQRSHLWMYCTNHLNPYQLCVFDFGYSKAGQHVDDFLRLPNKKIWQGILVCDGATCYKPVLQQEYVMEADVMSNVERRFEFLWNSTRSVIADEALRLLSRLRNMDWDLRLLCAEDRMRLRKIQAKPILNFMHSWLQARRDQVPHISVAAQTIDYALSRWEKLTHYIHEDRLVFSNQSLEKYVFPVDREDSHRWVFTSSIRGGDRNTAIMSLIATAKLQHLDPQAYLLSTIEKIKSTPPKDLNFFEMLPVMRAPSE